MVWKIKYTAEAQKKLKKLDKHIASEIMAYIKAVSLLNDPMSRGRGLEENWSGYWRYRIGDYRAVCQILKDEIVIAVVKIGHRRDVY